VAISRFVGNDRGDGNGGGAWTFPSSIEDWDISTGDSSAASATRVQTGGANASTESSTVSNETGAGADDLAAITAAIAPAPLDGSNRRYGYLGVMKRSGNDISVRSRPACQRPSEISTTFNRPPAGDLPNPKTITTLRGVPAAVFEDQIVADRDRQPLADRRQSAARSSPGMPG
jgi:hypothetical protein